MLERLYYANLNEKTVQECLVVQLSLEGVTVEIGGLWYSVTPLPDDLGGYLFLDTPSFLADRLFQHPVEMQTYVVDWLKEHLDDERCAFAENIRQRVAVLNSLEDEIRRWEDLFST